MVIKRIDRLNSDNLTYIQQGHITRLIIMQAPKAKDEDRLTDIFHNNCELRHIETSYSQDEVTRCGKRQDMTVTIKRLDSLNSDDLTYINQGHLTRLVLIQTPKDWDKDRLTDILHNNRALKHLQFKYRGEQDPTIGKIPEMMLLEREFITTSNTLSELQSFTIDWQRLSLTAEYSQGKREDSAVIQQLDCLTSNDLEYLQKIPLTRLTIMQTPRDEDKDRLADILHHNKKLQKLNIKCGDERDPAIGHVSEMALPDLDSVIVSNKSSCLESFSIEYQRLFLYIEFPNYGKKFRFMPTESMASMHMAIEQLDRLNFDDLQYILRGHVTQLTIMRAPRNEDKDRLADILHYNKGLYKLEIKCEEERDPAIGNVPKMTLLDLDSVILSNKSTSVRSVSIKYQRISLSTDFSEGRKERMAMVINQIDHLNSDDLEYILRSHVTRLTIMQIPRDKDKGRLADILHHTKDLNVLEIKSGEERNPAIGIVSEMTLLDLDSVILSDKSSVRSVSIEYQRLSLSANLSEGRRKNMTMVIKQLDHLNSDDLQYIQRGYPIKLTIMQTPRDKDKDRLADILHHNKELLMLEIRCREERDPSIGNVSEMSLLDLDSVILSNKSTSVRLVSIEYRRLSLSACFPGGGLIVDMVIKQLDHLNSNDLQYIQQGYLTRLTIMQTPRDEDKDQFADFHRLSQSISDLKLPHRDSQGPVLNAPEMKLLNLVALLTLNTFSRLESIICTIDYERASLISIVTEGKVQGVLMRIKQLSDLRSDDVGHLLGLEIDNTPLKSDEARLSKILKANTANFHLQIGHEQGSLSGFSPKRRRRESFLSSDEMSLWDIAKVVTSSTIESLKVGYWGCSFITGVSHNKDQHLKLTIDYRNHLNLEDPFGGIHNFVPNFLSLDDLETFQWDIFTELSIKFSHFRQGGLDAIIKRFSCIHFRHGRLHDVVITTPERKLQDLVDMVTSESPEVLESFSISCPRLSMTADFSQGNCQNMAMTAERLDCLNSDDLAFIQRGCLSRLTIKQTLLEVDKVQLIEIKRSHPSLDITYQEEPSRLGDGVPPFFGSSMFLSVV
ncbi:hypothetical protein BGX34_004050 [Mortierella sp. NVP85]|nr:hypothetical protein BGX34_004050 [Mortierella sp. NVP85]